MRTKMGGGKVVELPTGFAWSLSLPIFSTSEILSAHRTLKKKLKEGN